MKKIYEDLYIGSEEDYDLLDKDEYAFVLAAKEPFHRQLLGYTTKGAPKHHPEYLYALRNNKIILNMVDAPDPKYISDEMIKAALNFIFNELEAGYLVAIICNQGRSRSASIGFMYLMQNKLIDLGSSFEECYNKFKTIYPLYEPSTGVFEYAKKFYNEMKGE